MNVGKSLMLALVGACFTIDAAPTIAAPPWARVFSRTRVEADPSSDYPLGEECGPWMIMATTFSGDGAEAQARELVLELRSRYKLKAYTYQKKFKFVDGSEGRGVDEYGAPLRMRYQSGNERLEIAVLVGDYQSAADSDAQRALRKVKYAQPDSLKASANDSSSQTLAGFRMMQSQLHQTLLPDDDERKFHGPMGHAFITANPLIPQEYFAPKGLDKLVIDMNKGIKHSLLECKGKYTVKVATFTGKVVIDQKKIKQIESGADFESDLDKAADKAHKLCEVLRKEGAEAYEFHDRYQSIVTIGSFNSVGTPRADGKIEINPAMFRIIQTYGAETQVTAGQSQPNVGKPKVRTYKGDRLVLDLSPIPVEVPKRSIAADYGRTALN
jgi:hypothetical protein